MGWNPFAKAKPTPLFDLIANANMAKANAHLDEKPDELATLAKVISHLDMMSASMFVRSLRDYKIKAGNLDVLSFEALAFSAFAIRKHFDATAGEEEDDEDDSPVGDAFQMANTVVLTLVDDVTGWADLPAVWRSRAITYGLTKTYADAIDRFYTNLLRCYASDVAMVKYPDPLPGTISLEEDSKVGLSATAFAKSVPANYAETVARIVDVYGFRQL